MANLEPKVELVDLSVFPERLEEVRSLILEYADSLCMDLCFQNFDKEMEVFPGDYSPPDGALLMVLEQDTPIGCVAIRKIDQDVCEMKRLYVRPNYRGKGFGKMLAQSAIERGRKIGYKRTRLDTLPSMKAAISMYTRIGFKPIEAYRYKPASQALFFELQL